MKLSVIVPIYNVHNYLNKCLDSLHAQSLNDMEIICINDGSTDGSERIVAEYLESDSRFRLVDKNNTGYGNTINVGLAEAKGEYIAIVESDDYIDPNMMEELVKLIDNGDVDIVKSNFYEYSEADEESVYFDCLKGLPKRQVINPMEVPLVFIVLQSIWSSIYRTSFLRENYIRFHETPGASFQDVSFAFMAFANADRILLTDEAYYHYRVSNPNSSVKMINKLDKLKNELDYVEEYAARHENKQGLLPISSRLVFRVLLENYYDSFPAYQFAILNELERRLRIYDARGDLKAKMWDDGSIVIAKEILADKNAYYKKTGKKIFDYRLLDGTINLAIYKKALIEKAKSYSNIIIYGAGKVGKDIKNDLIASGCDKSRLSFAVSDMDDNSILIDGIKVQPIENYLSLKEDAVVFISVKEASQIEILEKLKNMNFKNIITLTDEIRNAYQ